MSDKNFLQPDYRRLNLIQGMSVIELLVVIGIIGLLSLVAIPGYSAYSTRAKMLEAINLMEPYITKINEYYNQYGTISSWGTQDAITVAKTTNTKIVKDIVYYNESATSFIRLWVTWQPDILPEYDNGTTEARLYIVGRENDGIIEWICAHDTRDAYNLSSNFLPGSCKSEYDGTNLTIIRK